TDQSKLFPVTVLLQYARLSYASHCAILGCFVQIRTSSVSCKQASMCSENSGLQQVEILTGLGCTTRVALRFPYSRECGFRPSSGKQILASHPFVRTRFSRETLPPCASAIWRLSARPMPDPPGLVVKYGTKRLAGFAIPGPSSCTYKLTQFPMRAHP